MKHKLSATAMSNLYTMGVTSKTDARQTIPKSYVIPGEATRKLRAQLILEEALETVEGLGFAVTINQFYGTPVEMKNIQLHPYGEPNLGDIIDGCCDTIYVAVGTLCAVGAPDESHMELVNKANNAKFPSGKATLNPSGKFLKPEGWVPPNHQTLIQSEDYHRLDIVSEELVECPAPPVCKEHHG